MLRVTVCESLGSSLSTYKQLSRGASFVAGAQYFASQRAYSAHYLPTRSRARGRRARAGRWARTKQSVVFGAIRHNFRRGFKLCVCPESQAQDL